jgi:hypothetical protein
VAQPLLSAALGLSVAMIVGLIVWRRPRATDPAGYHGCSSIWYGLGGALVVLSAIQRGGSTIEAVGGLLLVAIATDHALSWRRAVAADNSP